MKTKKRILNGASFVVTGAAGGLGLALCAELGRKGARIIGFDADPEALKATSAALQQEGIDYHLQLLDITDAYAVRQALQGLQGRGALCCSTTIQRRCRSSFLDQRSSAICTAFRAAPFRSWSPTTNSCTFVPL